MEKMMMQDYSKKRLKKMRSMSRFALLIAAMVFTLVFSTSALACINITDDDTYINDDTVLCGLVYQVNDTGNNGVMIINASDIVLDCNGSLIRGNMSGYAIYSESGSDNVTILDCDIYNYSKSIYVYKPIDFFVSGIRTDSTMEFLGTDLNNSLNMSNVFVNSSGNNYPIIIGTNNFYGDNLTSIYSGIHVAYAAIQFGYVISDVVFKNSVAIANVGDGINIAISASSNPISRFNSMQMHNIQAAGSRYGLNGIGQFGNISAFDSSFSGATKDVYITNPNSFARTHVLSLVNTSVNNSKIDIEQGDYEVHVKEYVDIHVNDTEGLPVGDANVVAWDGLGRVAFSKISDSNGYVDVPFLTGFFVNVSDALYVGLYTMNTTAGGYAMNSAGFNISDYSLDISLTALDSDSDGDPDPTDCAPYDSDTLSPYDDLLVNRSITLCLGSYSLVDKNLDGIFNITLSGITVECNGASLTGDGSGSAFHIINLTNISLHDCALHNYTFGFFLNRTDHLEISENIIDVNQGVYLQNSTFASITSNTIQNSSTAILTRDSYNTTVSDNLICHNTKYISEGGVNNSYSLLGDRFCVYLDWPDDDVLWNTTTNKFVFSISDRLDETNCSLYVNGVKKATNVSTQEDVTTLITYTPTIVDRYWDIRCIAQGGHSGNSETRSFTEVCGNNYCGSGETSSSCPADCSSGGGGDYEPGIGTCGDGTCDSNEDSTTCPEDCPKSYEEDDTEDADKSIIKESAPAKRVDTGAPPPVKQPEPVPEQEAPRPTARKFPNLGMLFSEQGRAEIKEWFSGIDHKTKNQVLMATVALVVIVGMLGNYIYSYRSVAQESIMNIHKRLEELMRKEK